MTPKVFVIDKERKPCLLTHPARARKLLRDGKAKVARVVPFTIQLSRIIENPVGSFTIGIDDGAKSAGIAVKDIKTVSYNLNEEFQWNDSLKKSESIGYRTTNSIQVTLTDLSKVGSVIDSAVQAGANSVSSVSFELSQAKQDALKTQALAEAAQNAKAKAASIASGLGVAVGQVYSASESSNYYTPMYRNYAMESAAPSASGATTPITPGDIEFSATVNVQFEIQ